MDASGKSPDISSLLSVLETAVKGFERFFVVLDAVDESMPRDDLLRVIRDLAIDARFSGISLLVTSRQYIDIESVMETCSTSINMSNQFIEYDIRMLVKSTVDSDKMYQKWPEDLKHELIDIVPKKAKGM